MLYSEILSPAGSVESLYAAVNAGCDAVYMGGSMFGARAYAQNPGCEELAGAIRYCHLYNVKLYLTVNTLLKDSEINSLYEYIKPYYEAGLDAAIVQDTGVLRLLHRWFPDLKLHASTQMALVTGQSADMLKKYGVTRIIPARELSLLELKQIRSVTDIETEVFVHGALCYCYSGQCLFSGMSGTRSGNRGRCTQPCRLPYITSYQGKEKESYILSMKELCALPYIGKLIEAGVSSFKIEGRMKRPAYTAFVTSMYRKYINLYIKLGKDGYSRYIQDNRQKLLDDMELLAEVYNRQGFTCGYLEGMKKTGQKGDMLASMRPNHGGVYIGEVIDAGRTRLKYKLAKDIKAHDVIEFRNSKMKPLYEYTTGSDKKAGEIAETKFTKGCIINKKDKVYRTRNASVLGSIKNEYIDKNKKVIITGRFKAAAGERACLSVKKNIAGSGTDSSTECNIEAIVYGDICERAQKSAASEETVKKSILQTGDTEFEFRKLEVLIDKDLFLPVSQLKNLRRQALDKLRDKITGSYARKAPHIPNSIENSAIITANNLCYTYKASVMTMPQLDAVLNNSTADIAEVYIKTELLTEKDIQEALLKVKSSGRRCYIVMPHIFRQSIWNYEQQCAASGKSIYTQPWDGYIIRNFEEYIFLTKVLGIDACNIITDSGLYIMNHSAASFWEEQGITRHTAPFELEISDMKNIAASSDIEAVIYTHIPLMVSAQCTIHNINACKKTSGADGSNIIMRGTDGREFITVNYCKYCYNTIYQSEPLSVVNYVKDLSDIGINSFRYDFTIEGAEDTDRVLSGKYSGKTHTGHYFSSIR